MRLGRAALVVVAGIELRASKSGIRPRRIRHRRKHGDDNQ